MKPSSPQDVKELVVDPLTRDFSPPRNLADAGAQSDYIRKFYVEPLQEFPRDVLAVAYRQVALNAELRTWPMPKVLIDACKRVGASRSKPGVQLDGESKPEWPWERRTRLAREHAEQWLESWPKQAASGVDLDGQRRTVMVCTPSAEGWASDAYGWIVPRAYEEMRRSNADTSTVEPPAELIDDWRRRALARKHKPTEAA